jgi:hypothetical protein
MQPESTAQPGHDEESDPFQTPTKPTTLTTPTETTVALKTSKKNHL